MEGWHLLLIQYSLVCYVYVFRCYAQIARCHGQLQQGMHVESGLPQYVSAVRSRYNVRAHMYSI